MTPGLVWRRLLGCFLCGMLLGPGVVLLRPLHRRLPRLSQAAVCLELLAAWLFALFGICRGDLRMGYYLGLLAGAALWERLFGGAVSAFFGRFWHFAVLPLKITRKIFHKSAKFLFSRWKKWSTIQGSNRQIKRRRNGG